MKKVFMKAKKRLNIYDLQKATGLSVATLSRAFNNSREISDETRAFVLKKADEIGYTPHPGARTLKLNRTGRWGLLVPHLANPWYAELTESFDHEARRRKSMLMLALSHYDPDIEAAFLKYWATGEVDGIIVTATDIDRNYEDLVKIQARRFPMVFLYGSPNNEFDYVTSEVKENTLRVLRHFHELGHRRIGYVSLKFAHDHETQEFAAYKQFLKEIGSPLRDDYLHFNEHDYEAGAAAWERWRNMPGRPTAVFCKGDVIACDLIKAVRKSGLDVPTHLSIVGQGDIAEADRMGLTTLRMNRQQFASSVFELLGRSREEGEPLRAVRAVPTELIWRDSIAAAPR